MCVNETLKEEKRKIKLERVKGIEIKIRRKSGEI